MLVSDNRVSSSKRLNSFVHFRDRSRIVATVGLRIVSVDQVGPQNIEIICPALTSTLQMVGSTRGLFHHTDELPSIEQYRELCGTAVLDIVAQAKLARPVIMMIDRCDSNRPTPTGYTTTAAAAATDAVQPASHSGTVLLCNETYRKLVERESFSQ